MGGLAAPLFAQGPVPVTPPPVTYVHVQVPATVSAGGQLCFTISSTGPLDVVVVEVAGVPLRLVRDPESHVGHEIYCASVPVDMAGATITITVITTGGTVVTAKSKAL